MMSASLGVGVEAEFLGVASSSAGTYVSRARKAGLLPARETAA